MDYEAPGRLNKAMRLVDALEALVRAELELEGVPTTEATVVETMAHRSLTMSVDEWRQLARARSIRPPSAATLEVTAALIDDRLRRLDDPPLDDPFAGLT